MSKKESRPLISVIMPVYNEQKYIYNAIQCILQQTEDDFELLIFDDASTDQTVEVVRKIHDDRIFLYVNTENKGIVYNLNQGLEIARGRYIARMDGDDLCVPTRFQEQIEYLQKYSDVGIVGSFSMDFGGESSLFAVHGSKDNMRKRLLFGGVFAHPSFFMRKDMLNEYQLKYSNDYKCAEDYQFLVCASEHFSLGVVEKVLVFHRVHKEQTSYVSMQQQKETVRRIKEEFLNQYSIHDSVERKILLQFLEYENITDEQQLKMLGKTVLKISNKKDFLWDRYIENVIKLGNSRFIRRQYNISIISQLGLYVQKSIWKMKRNRISMMSRIQLRKLGVEDDNY